MLAVLAAVPLSFLALPWGPPAWHLALADLVYVPLYFGAALLCFVRAARSSGPDRRAWAWVGAAPLCFGLGQSDWAYIEASLLQAPFPSQADVLFLLQPVMMGLGLLSFPRFALGRADALKRRLDVAIIMGAVLTVTWFGLGRHIVHIWQGEPLAMLISLAYPALDIWLLSVLLWNALQRREGATPVAGSRAQDQHQKEDGRSTHLLSRLRPLDPVRGGLRGAGVLLVLSVLSAVVADVGFALGYGLPNYHEGNTNDLFWTLAAVFLGLAALVGRQEGRSLVGQFVRRSSDNLRVRPSRLSRQLGVYGPYLALTSCFVLLFVSLHDHELLGLLIGAAAVTVLVLLRQMVGILENERLTLRLGILSRDLEDRVRDRTAELEVASGSLRQLTGELDARVMERTAQLEASQAELAFQTRHDALTGVPNRSLFEERLDQVLSRGEGGALTAVLYFNLDGFKGVNDRFGHARGDELLRELARRFQPLMRRPDGQAHPGDGLGRCGGDEFVLAFPQLAQPADAESCARRVAAVIGGQFLIEGQPVNLTASIGVSLSPADSLQAAVLIRQADMAMSEAKSAGRDNVRFYAPQMNRDAQKRVALEHRLRLALRAASAGAGSGLNLWYQPQYPLQGASLLSRPCSFEALLRWTDAELGEVSPAVFVPVAEDSGLIVPLGQWVLRQACAQLALWPGVRIAVNVAAAQFERPEFVQEVQAALQAHDLPGSRLELELTERQVVGDPEGVARKMHELRALGVLVALDDFGVGQSALGHLLKLPVSVLKVDRLFIQGLNEVGGAPRVLQAIVALAHALDIEVVAEGVETQAQLGMVRDLGCDLVQGYLTGRAVGAREAGALLALTAGREQHQTRERLSL